MLLCSFVWTSPFFILLKEKLDFPKLPVLSVGELEIYSLNAKVTIL